MRLEEDAERGMRTLASEFHQDWRLLEATVKETSFHAGKLMNPAELRTLRGAVSKAIANDDPTALRNPFRRAGAELFFADEKQFWSDVLVGLEEASQKMNVTATGSSSSQQTSASHQRSRQ
jgi:hypothetical protein